MKKMFLNILPMLAIVAGIAGAFGFDAKQNHCEDETIGYDYTGSNPAGPTLPPDNPGSQVVQISGGLGTTYDCVSVTPVQTCRWVYFNGAWSRCLGQRQPIAP